MHAGESLQLAAAFVEDLLGRLGVLDPLPEFLQLGVLALGLAQLGLDRLELLAEEMLALGSRKLVADLGLDLARQLHHGQLPGEQGAEHLQAGLHVQLGEGLLLLVDRERKAGEQQVGQGAGLARVHHGDLKLLGQLAVALLDHPVEQAVDVVHQGVDLDALFLGLLQRHHPSDEERLGLGQLDQPSAVEPLDDDARRAVGELEHLQDGADAEDIMQVALCGLVRLGPDLGDQAERAADADLVEQPDPRRPADDQRARPSAERPPRPATAAAASARRSAGSRLAVRDRAARP